MSESIQERLRQPWTQMQSRRVVLEREAANVIDGLVQALTIARTTVARQKETYIRDEDLRVIDTALAAVKGGSHE